MTAIALSPLDLALAALLLVAEAGLSLLLGLGLHRQVAVAAARMVVQLLLVGYGRIGQAIAKRAPPSAVSKPACARRSRRARPA